jgi:hypothetical protein
MNAPSLIRIATLATAITLTGLPRLAAADPTPTLTVVLQVPDDDDIPLHVVALAKPEVERIFRDAGVTVIWSDAATRQESPLDSLSSRPGRGFGLVVLSRKITDRLTVATDALGGAAGEPDQRRRMAYVFYHRVERIARTHLQTPVWRETYEIDTVILLAHAMAHEIGHLLLLSGHSAAGLMRADWSADDLRDAIRGDLNFNPEQAEEIRNRLLEWQPAERNAAG